MHSNIIDFPSAPWTLKGKGLQSFFLTKSSRLKKIVPKELKIVNVIPGYTITALSAGYYDSRSSLSYNELIVCPALVSYGGKIGLWVSNIYVDSLQSQKGGKEIWKLDKQLVQFNWESNFKELQVSENGRPILSISINKSLKLPMPSLSIRAFFNSKEWVSGFIGRTKMKSKIGKTRMEYDESLFGKFQFAKKGLGLFHYEGQMIAQKPDILFSKNNITDE